MKIQRSVALDEENVKNYVPQIKMATNKVEHVTRLNGTLNR